jgi:protease IV
MPFFPVPTMPKFLPSFAKAKALVTRVKPPEPYIAALKLDQPIHRDSVAPFIKGLHNLQERFTKNPSRMPKVLLVELDTPGGTPYHSDELRLELEHFKQETKIPVVALMKSCAASGGLFPAMAADKIFASPETITGSVGVIGMWKNTEKLLGKIGIKSHLLKTGSYKTIPNSVEPLTTDQHAFLKASMDRVHHRFKSLIVKTRTLKPENIEGDWADGRTLDGEQALAIGLIDGVGGRWQAINTASRLAGFEKNLIVKDETPKPPAPGFMVTLLNHFFPSTSTTSNAGLMALAKQDTTPKLLLA